jgi:hypothetical protein
MIFGPILLILILLLTKKEEVGCGIFGALIGVESIVTEKGCRIINGSWLQELIRNAAGDAGSAGWYAVMLLMGLLFVDPDVRARPRKIIDALSNAGILISTLYLMFLAVSIIDFCLQFTGLPTFLSLDVLGWLQSLGLGQGGSVLFQLLALLLTMVMASAGRFGHFHLHSTYVHLLLRSCQRDYAAGGACRLRRVKHHQGRTDGDRVFSCQIRHRHFHRALYLCDVS